MWPVTYTQSLILLVWAHNLVKTFVILYCFPNLGQPDLEELLVCTGGGNYLTVTCVCTDGINQFNTTTIYYIYTRLIVCGFHRTIYYIN